MKLILSVLSFKNQFIAGINDVAIDYTGGSIGRSVDNTLVLPDSEKIVSRHHANIYFENGCYYLSDTSLSGIYINNRETPLHNATQRIDNGMILKIGEYEISVSLVNEQVNYDNFPFADESYKSLIIEPEPLPSDVKPLFTSEEIGFNPLMADNLAKHEELIPAKDNEPSIAFESDLQTNRSPLLDSYIAPAVSSAPTVTEEIPENLSFDDFFSDGASTPPAQVGNKSAAADDFEALFGVQLSAELEQPIEAPQESSDFNPLFIDSIIVESEPPPITKIDSSTVQPEAFITEISQPSIQPVASIPPVTHDSDILINEELKTSTPAFSKVTDEKTAIDSSLFGAFLQGVKVKCVVMSAEQQAETLYRIGQMFRELIVGTVAVLRSRAEFKSLCRVSMTVIKATDNNPLKFTVSNDDVLRQLIENDMDGFVSSTLAIEEAFNDIMNHQLAMQAGIQASLTDLLKTFDPKVIEKQFGQGIILQKRAKCWDKYEETYRNTVEEAVENFFGDEFVKAYEKQMSLLKARKK
jgi:type VI secretion system protein